jgi:hypothetical protein
MGMNEHLKKLEKHMFIDIYGEEEFEKLRTSPKTKLPKTYSNKPPQRLRLEIDKLNNK